MCDAEMTAVFAEHAAVLEMRDAKLAQVHTEHAAELELRDAEMAALHAEHDAELETMRTQWRAAEMARENAETAQLYAENAVKLEKFRNEMMQQVTYNVWCSVTNVLFALRGHQNKTDANIKSAFSAFCLDVQYARVWHIGINLTCIQEQPIFSEKSFWSL